MMYDFILSVVLVLIVVFSIRPGFEWIVKHTPEGRPVEDMYIYLVILLALLSGIFSHWVDIGILVGPFIVGLAVPEGPPLGAALVDKLKGFSSGVLLPTFVTLVTLRANLGDITASQLELASVILVVITFSTKIAATTFAAMNYKMPLNDALALGLILSTKGVVDLANYSFSRDYGLWWELSCCFWFRCFMIQAGNMPAIRTGTSCTQGLAGSCHCSPASTPRTTSSPQ